jgi:hypothetical protein
MPAGITIDAVIARALARSLRHRIEYATMPVRLALALLQGNT